MHNVVKQPLPSDIYREHLTKDNLQLDQRQLSVLQSFDHLSFQLKNISAKSLWRYIINFFSRNNRVKGIYLWGSVGIGKTFLMDCFFDSLTTSRKRRIHFHHFMQEIHAALQQYSGQQNPLRRVAKKIKAQIDILCLDEFFVSDILDAMLLSGLLQALFQENICFVTTSNIPPHLLYKNGLQRENFLQAIQLLERELEVIHLASETDYRLMHVQAEGVYSTPLNEESERHLEKVFQYYAHEDVSCEPIEILGRKIPVVKSSSEAIWLNFEVICGDGRCQQDYLQLAKQFRFVLLSNVPVLTSRTLDEVTRFIQLVDIFYDAKIKLVISAETVPNLLYTQGKLFFAFQRTVSRLIEMQSMSYYTAPLHNLSF